MKERPILYSAPMARSILEGRKTQTRRVLKAGFSLESMDFLRTINFEMSPMLGVHAWFKDRLNGDELGTKCPYGQPGDRLWVRETWKTLIHSPGYDGVHDDDSRDGVASIGYKAGGRMETFFDLDDKADDEARRGMIKWKPAIHMPHWASRITLEVTAVRVERLQGISEADAMAEGLTSWEGHGKINYGITVADVWETDPKKAYRRLWESINGPGSWDANPWVWVIEFKRVEK